MAHESCQPRRLLRHLMSVSFAFSPIVRRYFCHNSIDGTPWQKKSTRMKFDSTLKRRGSVGKMRFDKGCPSPRICHGYLFPQIRRLYRSANICFLRCSQLFLVSCDIMFRNLFCIIITDDAYFEALLQHLPADFKSDSPGG